MNRVVDDSTSLVLLEVVGDGIVRFRSLVTSHVCPYGVAAKTMAQIRSDSVVPRRQCVVGFEAELSDVLLDRCGVSWVVSAIEVGIDREAGT